MLFPNFHDMKKHFLPVKIRVLIFHYMNNYFINIDYSIQSEVTNFLEEWVRGLNQSFAK